MRFKYLSVIVLVAACGDSMTQPPLPDALPICTAFLPSTAKPSLGVASGLGALTDPISEGIDNSGACTEVTTDIKRAEAGDIVPAGYVALGRAITFTGPDIKYPHGIDFVIPADMGKAPAGAPTSRVVIVEKRFGGAAVVTPVSNVLVETPHKRVHFHSDGPATYQAAIPTTAGAAVMRRFTYRAAGGASMGGIGSSINFWRHPERYDALAVMGADPGPDLTYTLGLLRDWFFGGFCSAEDEAAGKGKIGQTCAPARKPMTDQFEIPFDFERLYYQRGEGVGLTLRRKLYVKAFRDLARAFGNGAYATAKGQSTYLPPGVPASSLALAPADACANPTILKNFYDRRFNPTGVNDVITFCDGGDSEAKGYGVFDIAEPQKDPTQIMLAVDLNKNKRRDPGEPVLLQAAEPFRDVGKDGLSSDKEPGYNAKTNPDPSGDDFHWLHNPAGTEGNWRWDAGEPYEDVGVDGVGGKGCPVGSAAGCFDYGEGNGKFDYNDNVANWIAHDPRTLLEKLSPDAIDRLNIYYDAGIRDFLNAHVSTNSLAAALHARGSHVRVWDGFPTMLGLPLVAEQKFDVTKVDFAALGRRAYVRYGDPDLGDEAVAQTGNGRHVGSVLEALHRVQTLFYFVSNTWLDGETDLTGDQSGGDQIDDKFTAKNGRVVPYSVVLPPGYGAPDKKDRRYPVMYLFHGYGMDPKGFAATAAIAQSLMTDDRVPAERRMKKMIMVVMDGQCSPGGEVPNAPLPEAGDLCETGTFYTNHADGTAKGEDQLIELQTLIESKYRVRAPEEKMVRQ